MTSDGRWLAYTSTEIDGPQIYVRPMDSVEEKLRISRLGGMQPVWSESTHELLFNVAVDQPGERVAQVFALKYEIEDDHFKPSEEAVLWTENGIFANNFFFTNFDLDPARQRLLVRKSVNTGRQQSIHRVVLVENFFTELTKKFTLSRD